MIAARKLKDASPWKKSYDRPRQHFRKQRHYFTNKGPSNQSYGFSSSHVWMWELDYKEGWVLKNWCFWTVVLERTLQSPLDCKEINQSILKENWKDWWWSWNSNTLATWWEELTYWKRHWCWERLKAGREGITEDEMVRWHHWLNGHEFENSGSWWWTGKPDMLQSIVLQRVDTTDQLKWSCMKRSLGISNFLGELFSLTFYCFPLFLCIDH